MIRVLPLLSLLLLSGCSLSSSLGLAPSAPPSAYTLRPPPIMASAAMRTPLQLLIEEPTTVSRFDTPRIALSLGTRLDYYADVAWADRLPALVQSTMVEAFERSGRLTSVARDAAGVRGDLSLKTELREFQADYPSGNTDAAPDVRVRLAAKLVEPQRREVLASENFEAVMRAPSARLGDIAATLDAASQQVLGRLVDWTIIQASRTRIPVDPPPPGPASTRPRSR